MRRRGRVRRGARGRAGDNRRSGPGARALEHRHRLGRRPRLLGRLRGTGRRPRPDPDWRLRHGRLGGRGRRVPRPGRAHDKRQHDGPPPARTAAPGSDVPARLPGWRWRGARPRSGDWRGGVRRRRRACHPRRRRARGRDGGAGACRPRASPTRTCSSAGAEAKRAEPRDARARVSVEDDGGERSDDLAGALGAERGAHRQRQVGAGPARRSPAATRPRARKAPSRAARAAAVR